MGIDNPAMLGMIRVEVIYALPAHQAVRRLELPEGATAELAIVESRLTTVFPEISMQKNQLSCFGHLIGWKTQLHEGDRVEILRPLLVDPKDSRRRRAEVQATKALRHTGG